MKFTSWARRRYRRLALVSIAAIVIALVAAPSGGAHITFSDGTWSFNYFSGNSSCTSSSDPTTIIAWQYGEYQRMFDHLDGETHFGPATLSGSDQYLCARDYSGGPITARLYWNEQTGHGNLGERAHFRMWFAPHGHDSIVDKWSILTPHHESCCSHDIDEDWETWEDHVASEIGAYGHNIYYDHWYRYPLGLWRGFYQDGYTTRIGGLDDGCYYNPPACL